MFLQLYSKNNYFILLWY